MKKNGQALVEFIIILPVLIVILLGIVDFGMIFYQRNNLENNLDEAVKIWQKDKSLENINAYLKKVDSKISCNVENDNDTTTLKLTKDYILITPGLNLVLKSPYEISVNRVIYNG